MILLCKGETSVNKLDPLCQTPLFIKALTESGYMTTWSHVTVTLPAIRFFFFSIYIHLRVQDPM